MSATAVLPARPRQRWLPLTLLALVTVTAIALMIWQSQTIRQENERHLARHATEEARALSASLSDTIAATLRQAETQHTIARLLTNVRLTGTTAAELVLRNLLLDERAASPDISQIFAVSPSGTLIWSSLDWTPPPNDLSDRDYIAALTRNPNLDLFIGAPITGRLIKVRTVPYARAVRDTNGTLLGITVVSLRAGMLHRLAHGTALTADDTTSLLRDDGMILMRSDNADPAEPAQSAPREAAPVFAAASQSIPGKPLTVRVSLSEASQQAQRRELDNTLLRGVIVIAAVTLVLALVAGLALLLWSRATAAAVRNASLAHSQARLLNIIDAMYDGVMLRELTPEGPARIALANSAAATIFGVAAADLLGTDVTRFVVDEDIAMFADRKALAFSGGALPPIEYRIRRDDGSLAWVSAYTVAMPNERDPSRNNILTVVRDITEQHTREAALAEARARNDRILEVIPGVFYHTILNNSLDAVPTTVFVSPSVAALFGVTPQEATRPGFMMNAAEEDLPALRQAALDRAGPDGIATAAYACHLGGRRRWLRETIRRIARPDGVVEYFGVIADATAEHAAEAALEHRNWALAAYARSLNALFNSKTSAETAARVCQAIVEQPAYILACVGVPVHTPGSPVRLLAHEGPASGYVEDITLSWAAASTDGGGLTGSSLRDGQPRILDDALTDPSYAPWRERCLEWGIRSGISVPCVIAGKVVSTLNIYASEPNTFGHAEVEFFQHLSNEIGFAITLDRDRGRMRETEDNLRAAVQLGPGLLYRVRVHPGGVDVLNIFGDHTRISAGLVGDDGSPTRLRDLLGTPERVATILGMPENAEISYDQPAATLSGTTRWLRNTLRVTARAANNGGADVVGYLSDVTREMQEQLQRQQVTTLLTLGEMATGIAHELNQPLTSISFAAQNASIKLARIPDAIKAQAPGIASAAEKLKRVVDQTMRASRLIEHMRIFARNQPQSATPISWAAVLDSALEILIAKLSDCTVLRDIPADLPAILAAPIPLEQILINLISNAADAYNTALPGLPRPILVHASADDGTVILRVADRAGDIPPNVLPRVFEPFFTTKDPGRGTGLGLALAFGTVTELGGTITAANADGGAVFEIRLPACYPTARS